MKKIILLLISSFLIHPIYAEYRSNGITWIPEEEKYVTTLENSLLFECKEEMDKPADKRDVKSYTASKQKQLKKSINCKILGYANIKRNINYDTYIVGYKGKKYYLPSKFVVDNQNLEDINRNINDNDCNY